MAYLGRKGQTAPLASADLPTNSISTAHLINDSVTSAKIGVDVIVAEDLATNSVTVAELSDNAVDTNAILDDAVTAAKLANSINTDIATGVAALPKAGGAMTGAITTNSTFDGVDIATRDGVLTSTTTTANAALPKAGGTMTGTTNLQDSHLKILTNSADADDNNVWFQKSRHATDGSHTIVQDNDDLGSIVWDGSDGDSFETAAKIIGRIDGSPSAGSDMPGSLEFQTSGEGSASPTTRMVINSSGKVNMGTSSGRETTPHQKLIVGSSIKVGCGNHTPPTGAAGNFFGIDIQITANNVAQVIKTRTHSEACFYLICGHCSSDRWTDLMCTGPGTVYPIDQRTTQGSGITRSYSVSGENLYFTINDSSRSWSVFVTAMGANETSTTSSPCEGSLAV